MTRVALYARYSSDNQREASIDDQFRICREQATREKWKIVGTYRDAGISGASMILRPGGRERSLTGRMRPAHFALASWRRRRGSRLVLAVCRPVA